MAKEPLHKVFGTPLSQWVASMPTELAIDAVGMWQIIPVGRFDFGLEGGQLDEFVRLCLCSLLEKGAKPVKGSADGAYYWQVQHQYGNHNDEIVNAIINEWVASGRGDPSADGLWFALPHIYQAKR
jgi:hypothetical protein